MISKIIRIVLMVTLSATAGMLGGILYAPDKGRNTRGRLNYRLMTYRDRLSELVQQLAEQEKVPANSARDEGQRLIRDTKEQAEQLLHDVESLIGQINQANR